MQTDLILIAQRRESAPKPMPDPVFDVPGDRSVLLEAAIEALPFGVAVHDRQGDCVIANATARRLDPGFTAARASCPAVSPGADGSELTLTQSGTRMVENRKAPITVADETFWLTTQVDVTESHGIQRDLLERAYFDALTGLPNRALIEQSVEDLIEIVQDGARFALAFIDLDNFKHINDYYSHAAGDALLTKVATRIRGSLRAHDMLARVGGDEFVLLLTPIAEADEVRTFVEGIAGRLKEPFFIDGHEIFASASIGVSLYPLHGTSYDVLRRQADSAMYRVKGGVKGGVSLFEQAMGQAATARMEVEQRLRLAIRDRRFCCAYQPKVDMRSGAVCGLEVLLRWRDDQGLIQAPGDFVGLAVELGLINDITMMVLAETMRSIAAIDAAFGEGVSISINIAAKQACDVAFMSSFVEVLGATGLAERFILELTEEAFLAKGRFQQEVLPRIRAVGARVSIDDFGVGYSSLATLAEITADELKIDRSFITNIHERPRSQIVLKAIESLGAALGMTIIAEGVETHEEVAYLQAATRIRHAQGYYFAKPMLLEQIGRSEPWALSGREKPPPARPLAQARAYGGSRAG